MLVHYLNLWVAYEKNTRIFCYAAALILLILWEQFSPRRDSKFPGVLRWPHNILLFGINSFMIRSLFLGSGLWAAHLAENSHFGLFHWFQVPLLFSMIFTAVFLDWVFYYQHRAFHFFSLFWRIHRTHHTDLELDVTTGFRFHPLEALASMILRSFWIVMLGAPLEGVLFFEIALNLSLYFNHANVRIPDSLEKVLRLLFVTPEMHRVHHSANPAEADSDFGFILSIWDRLQGTYKGVPKKSVEKMELGLEPFRDPKFMQIRALLQTPFLDRKGHFDWMNLFKDP